MLEDRKISLEQWALLIVISRLMITMTYLSFFSDPPGNQSIWISDILTFFLHILITIPLYLLAERFKTLSIIEASEIILGKIGKIVGGMYIWFFVHITAITLRQFGEFFTAVPYPETPIIVFIGITALAASYAVHKDIENICRVLEIVAPIILFSIFLVIALLLKDMDFKNLIPIVEADILSILYGAFITVCRSSELLLIGMLYPCLNKPSSAKKSLFLCFLILTIIFAMISVSTIAIFGINEAQNRSFPFYNAVRMINISNFLERVDAVYFAIWVLGMFIKISLFYYLATIGIAQLIKLKDYKPIVMPLGAIIVSLSIWQADSIIALNEFLAYPIYTLYGLFFVFVLPLLLLTLSIIRNKEADSR